MQPIKLKLTRAEYDALLPMDSETLAAYLAADRKWTLAGVELTFANKADFGSFCTAKATDGGLWNCGCRECVRYQREADAEMRAEGRVS